jgi:hypothetical protein
VTAVGLHLGAQHVRASRQISSDEFETENQLELEVGLSVQVMPSPRISLAPWLGLQGVREGTQRAGGLTFGYDVRILGHERIGAFATATYGSGWEMRYVGLCLGVAYRYW